MGKRLISIFLLAAVLLLPCLACAETEPQRDIVVVVLADYEEDGNINQDALENSLKSFVAMAEKQGRNIVIYGPCTNNNKEFKWYQKPDDNRSSDDNWQELPQNQGRMIQLTIDYLHTSEKDTLSNKHLIFLVGTLRPNAGFANVEELLPAAQVDVIRLTEEAMPAEDQAAWAMYKPNAAMPSDQDWVASLTGKLAKNQTIPGSLVYTTLESEDALTDTLLTLLYSKDSAGESNMEIYSAYSAPTQEAADTPATVQDEAADPEATQEAVDSPATVQDETATTSTSVSELATVKIPVLPQLRDKTAFLYIRLNTEAPERGGEESPWHDDLQITSPDNTVYTLSLSDADDNADNDSDNQTTIKGTAVPDGALFMMRDFPSSTPGSNFQDWSLSINSDVESVKIYYHRIVFDDSTPIILLDGNCIESATDNVFIYDIEGYKREGIALTLNTEHPDIQQQIRLEGEESLRLVFTSSGQISEENLEKFFTADNPGVFSVTARLYSHNVPVSRQEYQITVVNRPPQATEIDIVAENQNLYWEKHKELILSLDGLFSDPDRDDLLTLEAWSAPGLNAEIKDQQLVLTHASDKTDGEPTLYTFTVHATDMNGARVERVFFLRWRSLKYDASRLEAVFSGDTFLDGGLDKNSEKTTTFHFTLNGKELDDESLDAAELLTFLKEEAEVFIVEQSGQIEPIKAEWNENNQLTASITVRNRGEYSFGWRIISHNKDIQLDSNAFHACPNGTITVENIPPEIANPENLQQSMEKWYWSLPTSEVIWTLEHGAFTDNDNEQLSYHATVSHLLSDGSWQSAPAEEISLPYEMKTADDWGTWKIEIVATDAEGASSECIEFTYTLYNAQLLTICIVAAVIVLALLISLVIWLRKPAFGKNTVMHLRLNQDDVTLLIAGWKKSSMPLSRFIPAIRYTLLSEDTCEHLANIYVKPMRNGFALVDKNRSTVLAGQQKAHFDQVLDCTVDGNSLSLTLENDRAL